MIYQVSLVVRDYDEAIACYGMVVVFQDRYGNKWDLVGR